MGGGPLNGLREPMKCRIPKLPTTAGDTNDGDDYKHRQEKKERNVPDAPTRPATDTGTNTAKRKDKRKTTDTHLPRDRGVQMQVQ